MSFSMKPSTPQEGHELLSSKGFNEPVYTLTYADVIELLGFMFDIGYISYEHHERIHELIWEWKVMLDNREPRWTPTSLKELVKEVRNARTKKVESIGLSENLILIEKENEKT